jgi:uncharacterized protein YecE (DUF72 family)
MYIGLPQWQHTAWHRIGLHTLADYSRYFTCVEGNTTFYALPNAETVLRWRDMTGDGFRFCFKFPATISHQAALRDCDDLVSEFFHTLAPLASRLGQLWLQLPAAFGPQGLPALWRFLDALPAGFSYGVEVRHPAFFAKGEEERQLNQGLAQRGINRVMLDSRPVHHADPANAAVRDAQRKKPQLPVHALCTADQPIVRFIGGDKLEDNLTWFTPWFTKLADWQQSHPPFLFIHTPDCSDAPQQAQKIWQRLQPQIPGLGPAPDWPEQAALF